MCLVGVSNFIKGPCHRDENCYLPSISSSSHKKLTVLTLCHQFSCCGRNTQGLTSPNESLVMMVRKIRSTISHTKFDSYTIYLNESGRCYPHFIFFGPTCGDDILFLATKLNCFFGACYKECFTLDWDHLRAVVLKYATTAKFLASAK